ncbi:40S ribosomal protein mrp10 [Sporothrix stenoceras]|uniref:40S ribosomal protein mrp10 n=1 Tax=Sporothrix stenoceras TaxID=5173 RepID=A0ABR3YXK2_9PEZI
MVHKPQKLAPTKVLRVASDNQKNLSPCMTAMSTVLACWASAGFNTAGCAAVEASLRLCMDSNVRPPTSKNIINTHLGRFQKRVEGRVRHTGTKA